MSSKLRLRDQFPALDQTVNGHPLVYLDTAATSLKPFAVIDRLHKFYQKETANVHRGAHFLSDRTTIEYEKVRTKIKNFLHAKKENEIVFTSGTTGGINIIAQSYARKHLQAGDEILLTEMEHHSNIVPWQMVASEIGLKIEWVRVKENGELDLTDFRNKLKPNTKIFSVTHCSNTLGTVNPVAALIQAARKNNTLVVVDAAQSMTFTDFNVQQLDCDFLVFSAHKMYGPYGIGVLFGKEHLLASMPPLFGGGSMIDKVTFAGSTYLPSPQRFEAGTPNIGGVLGLGAAVDYIVSLQQNEILNHEKAVLSYAIESLSRIDSLQFVGSSETRVNLLSFIMPGVHSSDIGQILNQQGLAVRTGHHCNQPLMDKLGIGGTVRVSLGVYNSEEDIEILCKSLTKASEILK